ncbi:hypothetical protein EVAR_62292_1 [Eumeta japonica]|uniref:Uncharacterized protein n=1 Tax=Eumeta variegata TaxID=151549 RepID=A0A4C1ZVK4_EUMVA|nr:hypothetical protein EVAR_62292_1 [Eumeta japonica]
MWVQVYGLVRWTLIDNRLSEVGSCGGWMTGMPRIRCPRVGQTSGAVYGAAVRGTAAAHAPRIVMRAGNDATIDTPVFGRLEELTARTGCRAADVLTDGEAKERSSASRIRDPETAFAA